MVEILGSSKTVSDAYRAAEAEFGHTVSHGHMRVLFSRDFGKPPSHYLNRDENSADELLLLKRKLESTNRRIKELEKESSNTALIKSLLGRLDTGAEVEEWAAPSPKTVNHGTPTLFLSDLHHGEVVRPGEVELANEFNSEISRQRIRRVFERTCSLLNDTFAEPDWPEIIVAVGGDILSGNIHEEIRGTNDQPIFDALVDVAMCLASGLKMLADVFGKVRVPWVVGNHGRIDKKPRYKAAVEDNYEYMLAHYLGSLLSDDDRIRVEVSDSFSISYKVHNTRYLLTHGDGFRGGSGISGPILPWTLGDHRLRKQRQAIDRYKELETSYDVLLFGHWHQYFPTPGFIANGSLKGFDEFAYKRGFAFQRPQQALWITHPERGPTFHMPVFGD
ncbi:MAG: hypothetical protein QNJ16_18335 [Rhodobacter sp.]|nr:hypothetical protein [Rhodobacter sp.]